MIFSLQSLDVFLWLSRRDGMKHFARLGSGSRRVHLGVPCTLMGGNWRTISFYIITLAYTCSTDLIKDPG